ncbi:hypothetical protein MTR67_002746 [Solanum verrucosum]|uniref:Uncharacterized protein n=1 Tax=Solanum verrucosum TaxID=315347 RepID=A0AAF0PRG0_SOLVR|nr:hypothetical protein MTR67_002746 [Solanum verrucosum]
MFMIQAHAKGESGLAQFSEAFTVEDVYKQAAIHPVEDERLVFVKVVIFIFAIHSVVDESLSPYVKTIIFTFKVHPIEDAFHSMEDEHQLSELSSLVRKGEVVEPDIEPEKDLRQRREMNRGLQEELGSGLRGDNEENNQDSVNNQENYNKQEVPPVVPTRPIRDVAVPLTANVASSIIKPPPGGRLN